MTYTVAHVWHGNIFRLGDHLDRLLDGARKLRLDPGYSKEELAEITKRCVAMSQLRESFVNLTVTRGYGKRKGEKDLSKLTHQVYIYAIPYLWAFPPHEQIFGTTAIVPRHVRRAGRNTVDPTIKNYQWGDLTAASFEAKDRGARTAILLDRQLRRPWLQRGRRQGRPPASPHVTRRPASPQDGLRAADQMASKPSCDVTSHVALRGRRVDGRYDRGGVTPINTLDDEKIGNGEPGPSRLPSAIASGRSWTSRDRSSRRSSTDASSRQDLLANRISIAPTERIVAATIRRRWWTPPHEGDRLWRERGSSPGRRRDSAGC